MPVIRVVITTEGGCKAPAVILDVAKAKAFSRLISWQLILYNDSREARATRLLLAGISRALIETEYRQSDE